jgi:hypothetical protein
MNASQFADMHAQHIFREVIALHNFEMLLNWIPAKSFGGARP